MDEILASGKIIALSDLSSSSYFVYKGRPMGFEYELLREFAKHIDVKLEMKIVEDMDRVIYRLLDGQGDVIAANFTITKDRQKLIAFSIPVLETYQVLVQREFEPLDTQGIFISEIEQLEGKTLAVRKESSFYERLQNIMDESDIDFEIELAGTKSTEQLIKAVSEKNIEYTVADHNVALLNYSYYPNLDINLRLSKDEHVGWAVRQTSVELKDSIDHWLKDFKKTKRFAMIQLKYFKARTVHRERIMSQYSSVIGDRISPYDAILKAESQRLGWDWKLLAALVYHESHFNPSAVSWTGASGLMQLIPVTAEHYGVDSLLDPTENVHAGVSFLNKLQIYWMKQGLQSNDLIHFTLASYNVGLGHVIDACRLAQKYGRDRKSWKNVSEFLELKSDPRYYNDPVTKHGYCRGSEPVSYVDKIMATWGHYRNSYSQ
jgi:membrane-bound lytic murein transglycosylase F